MCESSDDEVQTLVADLSAIVACTLEGDVQGAPHRILFDTGVIFRLRGREHPELPDRELPYKTGYGSFGNLNGAKRILARIISSDENPLPALVDAVEQMLIALAG